MLDRHSREGSQGGASVSPSIKWTLGERSSPLLLGTQQMCVCKVLEVCLTQIGHRQVSEISFLNLFSLCSWAMEGSRMGHGDPEPLGSPGTLPRPCMRDTHSSPVPGRQERKDALPGAEGATCLEDTASLESPLAAQKYMPPG